MGVSCDHAAFDQQDMMNIFHRTKPGLATLSSFLF